MGLVRTADAEIWSMYSEPAGRARCRQRSAE